MKKLALALILCLGLQACEEPFSWEAGAAGEPLLVVEGWLTNERKPHTIILSQTVSSQKEIPAAVSGARVVVREGARSYVFMEEPAGSGRYQSEAFQAVFGKPYHLFIRQQDQNYTATTYMVPVTPFHPLEFEPVVPAAGDPAAGTPGDTLLQLRYQAPGGPVGGVAPAMEEIYLDWSGVQGYESRPAAETSAKLLFYTLSTLDVNQLFAPAKEKVHFPAGTRLLRKKYSLSPEQEAFIRSVLFETEWRGGIFDVQKGNVATNLSGGAVGFFAASTVLTDTTYVPSE